MSDSTKLLRIHAATLRSVNKPESAALIESAAEESERLHRELARANRIARAADRMSDAIRGRQSLGAILHPSIIAAADAYELAMSDPEAEAKDRGESCT